ncbi:3949_t:CDS:2, partial [Dentiscutata heterogama]
MKQNIKQNIFERHQGFDLANFDNSKYPLSEIPHFKVLKSETYGAFKAMVAQNFGILAEQIRFWIFIIRENDTVRLDTPLTDAFLAMTMEKVHEKISVKQNNLRLFMEVTDRPFDDNVLWFPLIERNSYNNRIMIFVKYFDPDTQSIEGLGNLYVKKFDKVGDIMLTLCEKKKLTSHTSLKIYEELCHKYIKVMNSKLTFHDSKIQNGDIICFQKALTEEESQKYIAASRIHDIPTFYKSIVAKFEGKDQILN